MPILTAYGHSWVHGLGATAPRRRLVDLVACSLGLHADNRGVSGTSSRQTADLVRLSPPPPSPAFLLMTGLNDGRLHGASPGAMDGYRSALDAILRAVFTSSRDAVVAVVEQPHLLDYSGYPPHDRSSDRIVDRGNEVLRDTVARHDRAVAVRVLGWDEHSMLDSDTVHPNDSGHSAVARAVAATLMVLVGGGA